MDSAVGAAELGSARLLYQDVSELLRSRGCAAGDEHERLVESSEKILARTRQAVQGVPDEIAQRAVVLLAYRDLLDIGALSALRSLQVYKEDSVVASVLKRLMTGYGDVCDGWRGLLEDQETLSRDALDNQAQELSTTKAASAQLLNAAEQLHKDSKDMIKRNQLFQLQVEELQSQNALLTAELQRFFAATSANASTCGNHAKSCSSLVPSGKENPSPNALHAPAWGKSGQEEPAGRRTLVEACNTPPSAAISTPQARATVQILIDDNSGAGAAACTPDAPAPRHMTLQALRDFMDELCESKQRADARLRSSREPRATLDEHLDAFLGATFRQPHDAKQWGVAVRDALNRYSPSEHDVALFQKMLANEVDEEFWLSQQRYQQRLLEALKAQLEEARPDLSPSQLAAALNACVLGSLRPEEWRGVVRRVHSEREAPEVEAALTSVAAESSGRWPSTSGGNGDEADALPELPFADFLKAVLQRKLEEHERALAPIAKAFRQVDTANTGYLDEEAFSAFCTLINPTIRDKEIGVLLSTMDPDGGGRVTFSSCAYTLTTELARITRAAR